jgi:hypothetical protein
LSVVEKAGPRKETTTHGSVGVAHGTWTVFGPAGAGSAGISTE